MLIYRDIYIILSLIFLVLFRMLMRTHTHCLQRFSAYRNLPQISRTNLPWFESSQLSSFLWPDTKNLVPKCGWVSVQISGMYAMAWKSNFCHPPGLYLHHLCKSMVVLDWCRMVQWFNEVPLATTTKGDPPSNNNNMRRFRVQGNIPQEVERTIMKFAACRTKRPGAQ